MSDQSKNNPVTAPTPPSGGNPTGGGTNYYLPIPSGPGGLPNMTFNLPGIGNVPITAALGLPTAFFGGGHPQAPSPNIPASFYEALTPSTQLPQGFAAPRFSMQDLYTLASTVDPRLANVFFSNVPGQKDVNYLYQWAKKGNPNLQDPFANPQGVTYDEYMKFLQGGGGVFSGIDPVGFPSGTEERQKFFMGLGQILNAAQQYQIQQYKAQQAANDPNAPKPPTGAEEYQSLKTPVSPQAQQAMDFLFQAMTGQGRGPQSQAAIQQATDDFRSGRIDASQYQQAVNQARSLDVSGPAQSIFQSAQGIVPSALANQIRAQQVEALGSTGARMGTGVSNAVTQALANAGAQFQNQGQSQLSNLLQYGTNLGQGFNQDAMQRLFSLYLMQQGVPAEIAALQGLFPTIPNNTITQTGQGNTAGAVGSGLGGLAQVIPLLGGLFGGGGAGAAGGAAGTAGIAGLAGLL